MKRTLLATALGVVVAFTPSLGAVASAGTPAGANPVGVSVTKATGQALPGSYIVTLRPGAEPRRTALAHGAGVKHVYRSALNGYSATLTAKQLDKVRRSADVLAVEEDQVVTADATQTMAPGGGLYGLDRVDQRALPLSGSYTYTTTASAVRAYVIDTGIVATHPDFGGRAQNVYDAFGSNGVDCNGHGTHVAGTIGGATYGLAKGSLLRGVRVLGCDGSGSTAGIIAAVDWVRVNAVKPAVANMSLGGGFSSALNTSVTNLSNSGVFIAVAAGNEGQNACNVSPASATAATTVAASDKTDTRASFSNFGSCTDVYAPGVDITSTWLNNGTNTISGTSMASPHVAGAAALYKGSRGEAASSTIDSWIKTNATANVVRGNVSGTPNRLLFKSTL